MLPRLGKAALSNAQRLSSRPVLKANLARLPCYTPSLLISTVSASLEAILHLSVPSPSPSTLLTVKVMAGERRNAVMGREIANRTIAHFRILRAFGEVGKGMLVAHVRNNQVRSYIPRLVREVSLDRSLGLGLVARTKDFYMCIRGYAGIPGIRRTRTAV
ncbi:hypothetical protein K501DRAFT_303728 [Backusella circina FSU 941]|nr:hypothetical protein K501DRAFT_303728 [Backusella circina FSU 941]